MHHVHNGESRTDVPRRINRAVDFRAFDLAPASTVTVTKAILVGSTKLSNYMYQGSRLPMFCRTLCVRYESNLGLIQSFIGDEVP